MGVITIVILCLILLAIIWFVQQSLNFAAYRFYPFVACGILIAIVFWLVSPREATSAFIQTGDYLTWVINSTLREACREGISFACPLIDK